MLERQHVISLIIDLDILAYRWNHFWTALSVGTGATLFAEFLDSAFAIGLSACVGIYPTFDSDSILIGWDTAVPRFRLPLERIPATRAASFSTITNAALFRVDALVARLVEIVTSPVAAIVVDFIFFLGGILPNHQ
jgi:hypothetical protein